MITSGRHALIHPIRIDYGGRDIEVLATVAWTHFPAEPATMEHPGRDEEIEIGVIESYYLNRDGEKMTYPIGSVLEIFGDMIKEEILAECVDA